MVLFIRLTIWGWKFYIW